MYSLNGCFYLLTQIDERIDEDSSRQRLTNARSNTERMIPIQGPDEDLAGRMRQRQERETLRKRQAEREAEKPFRGSRGGGLGPRGVRRREH